MLFSKHTGLFSEIANYVKLTWFMFGKLTHNVWQTDTKRLFILLMNFWYILILFFFKTYNLRGVFSVAFLEEACFDFLMGIFSICSCFFVLFSSLTFLGFLFLDLFSSCPTHICFHWMMMMDYTWQVQLEDLLDFNPPSRGGHLLSNNPSSPWNWLGQHWLHSALKICWWMNWAWQFNLLNLFLDFNVFIYS